MTVLQDLVFRCTAIKGYIRLVLMGWTAQIEEGSDTVYASKVTVANWAGVNERTVLRFTQALVKSGIMAATGEMKVWSPKCETPIYRINVQKIADLVDGVSISHPLTEDGVSKSHGVTNSHGCLKVTQGFDSGSSSGLDLSSGIDSLTTELRSVERTAESKSSNLQPVTKNLESAPTPTPTPARIRGKRSCKQHKQAFPVGFNSWGSVARSTWCADGHPATEGGLSILAQADKDDRERAFAQRRLSAVSVPAQPAEPMQVPEPESVVSAFSVPDIDDDYGDPCPFCYCKFPPRTLPLHLNGKCSAKKRIEREAAAKAAGL